MGTKEDEFQSFATESVGEVDQSLQVRDENLPLQMQDDDAPGKRLTTKQAIPQIVATLVAFSIWINLGTAAGFSAVFIPQVTTEGDEILLSQEEASWYAGLMPLTTPIGALVSSCLVDFLGRKATTKMLTIPFVLCWVLTACPSTFGTLFTGRVLSGVAAGMASASMVYVTEIAHSDMRAMLTNISTVMAAFGFVIVYTLGALLHWQLVAGLLSIFPLVSFLACNLIPESPTWLVSKGKIREAESALHWLYRNDPSISEDELKRLTSTQKYSASDKSTHFMETLRAFSRPEAYKPLLVLFWFAIFQQTAGCHVMLFYTVSLFQKVGSGINEYVASILVGLTRLFMASLFVVLSRSVGRRRLAFVSGTGMGVCMFIGGTSLYLLGDKTEAAGWVSLVCVLLYICFMSNGILFLPFSMSGELFPLDVRGVGNALCFILFHILMFIALKIYPSVAAVLQGYGVMWLFGSTSILSVVFVYFFLPETLGKSLHEIQLHFSKKTAIRTDHKQPLSEQNG